MIVRPEDRDVLLPAADDHPVIIRHHARGSIDPSAELLPDGLNIRQFDEIRLYLGRGLATGFVVGVDKVGSDTANLIEDVIATRKRDRDHQNHGRVPDHQTEGGQKGTNLVCP